VLGIDEVGVGSIAGPVTACGLVLPGDLVIERALEKAGMRDSKQISEGRREYLRKLIDESYIWYFICSVEAVDVRKGQMAAHLDKLFREILLEARLHGPTFSTVIIDGNQDRNLSGHRFQAIPKADDKSLTVASASIVAKTHRDAVMRRHHRMYPDYGFGDHKGYPTVRHKQAIVDHGILPGIHRSCKALDRITAAQRLHPKESDDGGHDAGQMRTSASDGAALRFRRGSGRFH